MTRPAAYRVLCGALGALLVLVGLALAGCFFAYQMPGSDLPIPTGPVGFYFVAFAGCALVAWGGALLGVARGAGVARSTGTATGVALALCGLVRLAAWYLGDYTHWPGEVLRAEAVLFVAAALAFVWLRPARERGGAVGPSGAGA